MGNNNMYRKGTVVCVCGLLFFLPLHTPVAAHRIPWQPLRESWHSMGRVTLHMTVRILVQHTSHRVICETSQTTISSPSLGLFLFLFFLSHIFFPPPAPRVSKLRELFGDSISVVFVASTFYLVMDISSSCK